MSAKPTPKAHVRFHEDEDFRAGLRELELADVVWESIVKMYRKRQAEDGLSQADWAARSNRPAAFINRLLRRPKNLTTATIARALSGLDAFLEVQVVDARAAPSGNGAHTEVKGRTSTVTITTDADAAATGGPRARTEVLVTEALN